MSFISITKDDVLSGRPVTEDLWTLIKDNFDDHESRISSLEGGIVVVTGSVFGFGGPIAPNGWLLCDGGSYSTTTYAALFSQIGYTFGGAGASFNVPNIRGRVVVGIGLGDATYSTSKSLANTSGRERVQLVNSTMPQHDHGNVSHNHTGTNHTHDVVAKQGRQLSSGSLRAGDTGGTFLGQTQLSFTNFVTITGATPNANWSLVGGDQTHENMASSTLCHYIIKT